MRTVFVSRTQGAPAGKYELLSSQVETSAGYSRTSLGGDQVLGHVGGGLEYRFTPHIGIFGEVGYDFPSRGSKSLWFI